MPAARPPTWDELIAKGKEGVAAGKIKYPIVFRGVSGNPIVTSWYPIFLSFGGKFFDDKWNVTFNSDAGKAAADYFVGTDEAERAPGRGRVRFRPGRRGDPRRRGRRHHPIFRQCAEG